MADGEDDRVALSSRQKTRLKDVQDLESSRRLNMEYDPLVRNYLLTSR